MEDQLDIFGQQPFFTINTQICFAFTTSSASSYETIVNTLTNGLKRLQQGFPWLACEVCNEGSGEENTGVYKFKTLTDAPALVVKDLRSFSTVPSMDDLLRAEFPIAMIDEEMVAPRRTFTDRANTSSAPAFLVQANFIIGGLLLTFLAQHNTMDMTGQAHIIRLFSKACYNEQFAADELLHGNMSRHNIVPLLEGSYPLGSQLDRHIVKPVTSITDTGSAPIVTPRNQWAYFEFSRSSLASLKSIASESVRAPAYVSTDDSLTAFIWQSIQRARSERLHPDTPSTIARAVDVRPHLKIWPMYPGPIQDSAYSTLSTGILVSEPLGHVALHLRSALEPEKIESHARAVATFLSRTQNKAVFSSTAGFDMSVDLILSSWARVQLHELDFNLGLGKPKAVRRPRFQALEGLVFLMPKSLDGSVAAAICLRDEDMNSLRADSQFDKYASYIG